MTSLQVKMISDFRRWDKKAYAAVYDTYSAALYGVTLRIVRSETLAQDVMQEAFIKIWKHADQYDPEKGTLFTWLLNIVRRTAIDKIRSASWQRSQSIDPLADGEHGAAHFSSQDFNTDHIGVRSLVDRGLEEKYRQVIDLMYFQGMTQQEVQEYLGIPLGTVKSRTRIALRKLRQLFASQPTALVLLVLIFMLA